MNIYIKLAIIFIIEYFENSNLSNRNNIYSKHKKQK